MVYIASLEASLVHNYWELYCFTSCFTGSSLLGMVYIVWLRVSLILPYWACFVLFHFMLHWFIPTAHCLYLFTSLTISSLLGMVFIVWLRASLVLHYWAWFVLFLFMLHWFFITGHDLCCFTSSLTCSSLLGIVCAVSCHDSLVYHYGRGLYCFTSCLTGSFLFRIVCIVSLPVLFPHCWAWFIMLHSMPHWFIITGNDLNLFTWWFIVSSLMGICCVVSCHVSLVHHYLAWFVLFHLMHHLIQPTISLEMPVPSQGHYGFHSFPVVDWFCLFI